MYRGFRAAWLGWFEFFHSPFNLIDRWKTSSQIPVRYGIMFRLNLHSTLQRIYNFVMYNAALLSFYSEFSYFNLRYGHGPGDMYLHQCINPTALSMNEENLGITLQKKLTILPWENIRNVVGISSELEWIIKSLFTGGKNRWTATIFIGTTDSDGYGVTFVRM